MYRNPCTGVRFTGFRVSGGQFTIEVLAMIHLICHLLRSCAVDPSTPDIFDEAHTGVGTRDMMNGVRNS